MQFFAITFCSLSGFYYIAMSGQIFLVLSLSHSLSLISAHSQLNDARYLFCHFFFLYTPLEYAEA